MIRVELGEEVGKRGIWRWSVKRYGLSGVSKIPLEHACRALRAVGINPNATAGLFREGRTDAEGRDIADLVRIVGKG